MEFYPGFEQEVKRKYTKRVNKVNQEYIKEALTKALEHSEELWETKEQSHAYIVGYLQGAIKEVLRDLE
jgi:hypothetical protein